MQSRPHATFDEERLLIRIDELLSHIQRLESEVERTHRLATLGLLSGSIAHEFNNILTPVLSYAQLALASPEDADLCQKALRKSVDGTQKAAQIASAMLGFVRDDEPEAVADVRSVVFESLQCLGRDLQREGIALTVEVPEKTRVKMRPVALEQVLINLILNALDAIRPAAGSLRISARLSERSTGNTPEVLLEVEDSGKGMSADLASRVFEPFVSSGTKDGRRTGTGLGLTICKRLVEEAGGSIGVRSEEGRGTTFTVRLPGAG
ncbi:MAG: HAMP domain-containing histidine kinase [Phycisphaerae bacterium]|nr:HAMP domain-containing histidine kinase [Phycisphaerae bacterium]